MYKYQYKTLAPAIVFYMRKKPEYQTKVYRLDKETNDLLVAYCEENGIAQAHVQSQAVKIYLAMKQKA